MKFDPSHYIVLRAGTSGNGEFIAFAQKSEVDTYERKDSQSVLVRFNVYTVNNNACETMTEARNKLADVKPKYPQACITMMAPHRLVSGTWTNKYYDAINLFD